MDFITELCQNLKGRRVKAVFSEGAEPRILAAVSEAVRLELIDPILVGKSSEISAAAGQIGVDLSGIAVIDPAASADMDRYADACSASLKIPKGIARALLVQPLNYASMMLKMGDADTLISGAITATGEVIAANKLILGFAEGITTISSFMVLEIPQYEGNEKGILVISDPAINIEPTAEELAQIAVTTAENSAKLLGWEPRVAMLSFSTFGSASHPKVQKVADATRMAKEAAPELLIDGELQLDAAIAPSVAKVKVKRKSPVAGCANTLIFPEINSANIGVKLIQRIGGAAAYGAVVQGLKKPVCDLSRGATQEDILGMIAVMATIAAAGGQIKTN